MRLAVYAGTSALVAAGALLKAFHQRPNFYSATVYLSQSNACVLILTNLALVCASTFIYGLQRLFYGPLRQIEIEQLTDKAWYAVLDTLLAMPSLSHDVSGFMLAIFVLLLAGKVWGWIGEGRVDILEQQPPQNPRTFHARLSSSLAVSVLFDAFMLQYCIKTVRDNPRPGMMVIFTFEFAILTIFSLFTLSRYVLALVEARILKQQTEQKIEERKADIRAERERLQTASADREQPPTALPSEDDIDENEIDVAGWEEKRRWLFGLELATDFIKLIIYSIFFAISLTFMGLPMHIMRDVYLTFSAFAKRIQDYGNYRRATQNMNDRYSDATAQELSNDNTCIVCRETMVPWEQPEVAGANAQRPATMTEGLRAKKLPCGHILHLRCLKAWLERQQACPTCRRPVIANQQANAATPGQPRIEGANIGAQPQAGGGDNAQPNNPGAAPGQPAPRAENRLRMLNLGPIRIGVYNGPAHQVQEALAQRRNPQAPHNTEGTGTSNIATAALGTQSTQVQLMQVEERLMHDARSLAIEQTQLLNVRALEAELARLRALHDRNQQGRLPLQAGPNVPLPPVAAGMPQVPTPAPRPFGSGGGSGVIALPQPFQPTPGQLPLGAGHSGLPQGVTLPEGWTITPMHRIGAAPSQQGPSLFGTQAHASATPRQQGPTIFGSQAPASATETLFNPSDNLAGLQRDSNTTTPAPAGPFLTTPLAPPPEPTSPQNAPPQERPAIFGNGSPAVSPGVPVQTRVVEQAAPSPNGAAAVDDEVAAAFSTAQPLTSSSEQTRAPHVQSSWTFNNLDEQVEGPSTSPETNGSTPESSSEDSEAGSIRHEKGKGRAVTVEDAQDTED